MTSPTAIHCPDCDRYLMGAQGIQGGLLRCKSCGRRYIVDLNNGKLTVRRLDKQTVKG